MSERITDLQPPRGLSRLLYRFPILLYRARLVWLTGGRFLLLTHIGRVSGLPRQTVLEVIRHDPKNKTYYAVSAWGEKSDWMQNIRKTPAVVIQVGRRERNARAEPLPLLETERELRDYAQRHPVALRALLRLIGVHFCGTEEDLHAIARAVIVVAFHPEGHASYALNKQS